MLLISRGAHFFKPGQLGSVFGKGWERLCYPAQMVREAMRKRERRGLEEYGSAVEAGGELLAGREEDTKAC